MKPEILKACDQLVAGAASGLYQGIIITALVAVVLRALRRTNAATRHAVWFGTLLLVASLMTAHCLREGMQLVSAAAKRRDLAAVPAELTAALALRPQLPEPTASTQSTIELSDINAP